MKRLHDVLAACTAALILVLANIHSADADAAWDNLAAAAKKEGKLIVSGPVGATWRDAIMTFQKSYPDVKIEFTPFNSRDYWPRVRQERAVQQYLWDVRVGGIDTFAFQMIKDGVIDPVRPELMLPEVTDESKWIGGFEGLFADNAKQYLPGFLVYSYPAGWVNRDEISRAQLSSVKDLLKPEFANKIAIQDFRGGAAVSVLSVMLRDYGEDFVTKLMTDQKVVATTNNRQLAEWVVRRRYPIALAVNTDQLDLLKKEGVSMNLEPLGGLDVTVSGFGSIQLLKNRPNPNATKLFINWLLTRDTQTTIAKTVLVNSRRIDVPLGSPHTAIPPQEAKRFTDSQAEPMLRFQGAAVALGRKLIP